MEAPPIMSDQTTSSTYERLLLAAGYVIVTCDAKGRIVALGGDVGGLVGQDAADLLGMRYDRFLPREWAQTLRARYKAQIADCQPMARYDFPILTHSGPRWVEHTLLIEYDAEGAAQQFHAILRPYDDPPPATGRALLTSDKRYRTLLKAIPDLLLVVNRDGVYLDYHLGDRHTMPLSHEQLHSILGAQLSEAALPPDLIIAMRDAIGRALQAREVVTLEYVTHLNGEDILLDVRAIAVAEDEALVIIRNASEFKRIEDELRRHIEDLTVLYQIEEELSERLSIQYVLGMALDAAMRLSAANSGFIALLEDGQLRLAHILGFYVREEVEVALKNNHPLIAEVVADQKARFIPRVAENPKYIPLLPQTRALMLIPLVSQDRLIGIINLETPHENFFTQDAFEFLRLATNRIAVAIENSRLHKQTEGQLIELKRLYEQVRRLEQLKTDMIRIASHDLRNPLAAILGFLELLQLEIGPQLPTVQRERLKAIEDAARRMQKITADILSLERIEQAGQDNTMQPFDLGQLARRTVEEQRASAQLRQQRLSVELGEGPLRVIGDPVQLHEAIANLVANAIKYTPDGGHIRVTVARTPDQTIALRVIDDGYGVPEGQQGRLFQPFFRAKTKETKHIEGTGLGLHLVKNIIERHNGRMFFQSVYGQGSTFGFDLPTLI